jgi:peptidoglycan/xylan/chitin deacetylase (PgdA/CDA1 family)
MAAVTGSGVRAHAAGFPRGALHRCVKTVAAGADVVRPPGQGVVVLAYHRVGGHSAAAEIDLPRPLFADQIGEIAARAAGLDDALEALAGRAPRGGDIVVTFDDGTADFVEEALPVLVEHRVPVVLYVATALVAEGRPFPHGGRPISWAALRDAVSTGLVTVGSHTHTHALLDRCPPEAAADELDRSIELIGEHVGTAPVHFAYPKALCGSARTREEVARRFRSAAVAGTRPNRYGATDPLRLARSPIQRTDGMRWFRRKVAGGMAFEDGVRRAANRLRYAGATS